MSSKQQGFTLIEVLIAGVILFSVLVTVSQVYQGANRSSERATAMVTMQGIVPLLLDTIRFRLRSAENLEPVNQEGILNGVTFQWQATVVQRGAPPDRIDVEAGEMISFDDKFYLWQVDLTLQLGNTERTFQFQELTWEEM